MKKKLLFSASLATLILCGVRALSPNADAQTYPVQQVQQIGPTDLFQDVPSGIPSAPSVYASSLLLGNYGATQPGNNAESLLFGGDFSTNLFSRGTSVGSITTTATYTADRWFAWSGTNTTLTVTQQTGATDISPGFSASLRVNKGSGTGVVQSCIAQVVETAQALRMQGQTSEFDFLVKAGPNFSAANSNLQVYITYGTGTDEGSSKYAFGLNAGGGGSTAWTTQTNAANGLLVPITTGFARYTVAAAIPATATELGYAICYTPIGTGVAGDWFEFEGAQVVPNSSLTSLVGTTGVVLNPNDLRAKATSRRAVMQEVVQQQRYTYAITEAAAGVVQIAGGTAQGTTTTCTMYVTFPLTMRAAPTYTNTLTASTFKLVSASQAATALSTPFSATLVANTVNGASINFTTTGMTAKDGCVLVGAGGGGTMLWSAEL